jgi:hypothetical protein
MIWPIPPARLGPQLLNCGCNEVDEVDRPQPGGAGCGHYFALDLRRRCASRTFNAAQLSAAIEQSNLTG